MIELTKIEMEDIWNNKPMNYLKSVKAARKGTKKYVVNIQGFERVLGPSETFTVYAKNREDASWKAKDLLREKHPTAKIDMFSYNFYT